MTKDDLKFRVRYYGGKAKKKLKDIGEFVADHKESLIVLAPIAWSLAKTIRKDVNNAKEEEFDRTHTYDPVSHQRIRHRPFTKSQKAEFIERRNNGESVRDILRDMRLF